MLSATISGDSYKGNGLVTGKGYSMLKLMSCEMDDGTPIKLVQLRNPWGRCEWSGDWSDKSDRWEENPKLRQTLEEEEVKNDGRFWMTFEDWEKSFNFLTVCPPTGGPPPEEDEKEEKEEDQEDGGDDEKDVLAF